MSERSSPAVPAAPAVFYIAVIMERRPARQGRWQIDRWQALGAVASTLPPPPELPNPVPVRQGVDQQQWLWRGLPLELHRDEAEGYYYNLLAERPSLYLLCRPEGERLAPVLVTASH
ncbi:MAG: DUF3305 domain-containing protein, partial [Candidatus Competibacteraceae bacterium]|nr:DUF3305 domain-containing protein [Candidatus Competibacteraceae bacterium]